MDRVTELGTVDDPASIRHAFAVNVVRLPDLGWIVLEDGGPLLNYAADGSFRRILGRIGSGPQELAAPDGIAVDATDSLWVSQAGRFVVFGPDGIPVRTIVTPGIAGLSGITPSGLPFGYFNRMNADGTGLSRFVHIWSRQGDRIGAIGPGASDSLSSGVSLPAALQVQTLSVSDTVFLAPGSWHTWLLRWTRSTEEPVVLGRSVWEALQLAAGPGPGDARVSAVSRAVSGGLWLLGAVRRVSREQEAILRERRAQESRVRITDPAVTHSARILNQVLDGVLVHLTEDGRVTDALTFPEYPWSFVDGEHFVTMRETDVGLIQIRIWHIMRACADPKPGK
jgi:hypothetical protein